MPKIVLREKVMERINGFIDINKLLDLPKKEIYDVTELLKFLLKNNKTVIVRKRRMNSQFVFSFDYEGETYYYKFDSLANPYNELIFSFIAADLGIDSLKYDIAKLGVYEGVLSKNFKVPGVKYISGGKLLQKFHGNKDYGDYNNLEDIWADLEEYYQDKPNMLEIVSKLMEKLGRIFIFDLLVGQEDRHPNNWGIVEYPDGNVDLQINLDNARGLIDHPMMVRIQLPMSRDKMYVEDMVSKFQNISSEEFSSLLPNFLWAISEENILKIFARIESMTQCPMPADIKRDYLLKFQIYYDYYEEILKENKATR